MQASRPQDKEPLPVSSPQPSFSSAEPDALADATSQTIGSVVAEGFLSPSLAQRMIDRADQQLVRLREQLDELNTLYTPGRTLHLLGAPDSAEHWEPALQIVQIALRDLLGASLTGILTVVEGHPPQWGFCQTVAQTPESWTHAAQESINTTLGTALKPALISLFTNHTMGLRALFPLEQVDNQATWVTLAWKTPPAGGTAELTTLMGALGNILRAACQIEGLRRLSLPADPPLTGAELLSLRAEWTEALCSLHIEQEAVLEALARWADARLSFRAGYSQAVAKVTEALAEKLSLNDKTVELVTRAAGLGSLGLATVPSQWLTQPPPLPGEILEQLRSHLLEQAQRLQHVPLLGEVMPYVLHAHERWDGSGLPQGLKGRDIPVGCRVIGLAGAYVGLRQPRPYRPSGAGQTGFSHAAALSVLRAESDRLWDPLLVDLLSQTLSPAS